MPVPFQTPYFAELTSRIEELGGYFNAHLHLDRAGTYHDTLKLLAPTDDASGLSLKKKHSMIPAVHASPAYDPDVLGARVETYLEAMADMGTRRADTVVDVTTDRVGRSAIDRLAAAREKLRNRIDFRIGAYSPLGYRDDEPQRFKLFEEAAQVADLLGLLPERDDKIDYPEHIGFDECVRRGLTLSAKLNKPIHVHVDQANHPAENASETVVRIAADLGIAPKGEPLIWLIHVISPSTYGEERFAALAASLAAQNIGVICCPSAAISMRQLRGVATPTYNSIARCIDLLAAGVQVRIGSDNICDITSPMGTPDLMWEVFVLANAMRYYDVDIIAKIATGVALDETDIGKLKEHLADDAANSQRAIERLGGRGEK